MYGTTIACDFKVAVEIYIFMIIFIKHYYYHYTWKLMSKIMTDYTIDVFYGYLSLLAAFYYPFIIVPWILNTRLLKVCNDIHNNKIAETKLLL